MPQTYVFKTKLQRVRTTRNAHTAECKVLELDPLNRCETKKGIKKNKKSEKTAMHRAARQPVEQAQDQKNKKKKDELKK